MKNKLLLILFTTIFLGLIYNITFVSSDTNNPCDPQINIVNQDPNPAVPGSYVKVLFQISGLDNPYCNGMTVKLNPEYPFSLDAGTNPIQSITGGTYSQGYSTVWNVPYRLRVADDALEGDYDLKLLYHTGVNTNFQDSSAGQNFNVSITDAQTTFDAIIQDSSSGQISLGIVNTGKNTANSLVVGIPNQDGYITTGASKQIIGNLASGDYTLVSFAITSRISRNGTRVATNYTQGQVPQLNTNSQELKVQVDYTDGIGMRRSEILNISVGNTLTQGNSSFSRNSTQFPRNSSASTNNSSKLLVYLVFIIIVGLVGYMGHKKYGNKSSSEKHKEKNSKDDPDWVSTERTHRNQKRSR